MRRVTLETNPLRDGLIRERVADPCAFVIFGGTGDLAHRKLMPALYSLYCQGLLPNGFAIVAVGRRRKTAGEHRESLRRTMEEAGVLDKDTCAWEDFAAGVTTVSADFTNVDSFRNIAETLGVEERGAFYDSTGALRDIIQNHGLQLLSLVAMEPPASLDPDDVRDEKTKVFRNVRRIHAQDVPRFAARGQYGSGFFFGERVKSYREEDNVNPQSSTETFVALELHIDNWRWSGVPFFIRTGKRLSRRTTEIAIQFKEVPDVLFRKALPEQVEPNVIAMKIQPDEGIVLKAESKVPGQGLRMRPVRMEFRYGSSFGVQAPEAYERLLVDATLGDSSLFARDDSVEECWEIVMPVLNAWGTPAEDFPNYLPGTWGPKSAFELIERTGRRWRRL